MSAPESLAEHWRQLAVRDVLATVRDHILPFLLIALVGAMSGFYAAGVLPLVGI